MVWGDESGVIILGDLADVCLYSKRWLKSASTDGKKAPKLLIKSTPSLLAEVVGLVLYLVH